MFELINNTNEPIELLDELEEYVNYIVEKEKLNDAIFNIIFVSNKEIRRINLEYRSKDAETDVISFALEDDKFMISPIRVLGDIYISYDKAIEQANEYDHSLKRELAFLITHGILHLLLYDHTLKSDEEIMFQKQDELLEGFGIIK